MITSRPVFAALAGAAALALVICAGCRKQTAADAPAASVPAAPAQPPVQVTLFFPGDDLQIHRELREVPELPVSAQARIRLVLDELLAGSRTGFASPFPWAATVEAVFVDAHGNAFVDLSAPAPETLGGTDTELALTYCTVSTVVTNCPGVERVQLLFGGHQVETLGHLDLSRPLAPRLDLIAR